MSDRGKVKVRDLPQESESDNSSLKLHVGILNTLYKKSYISEIKLIEDRISSMAYHLTRTIQDLYAVEKNFKVDLFCTVQEIMDTAYELDWVRRWIETAEYFKPTNKKKTKLVMPEAVCITNKTNKEKTKHDDSEKR